ncbi:hypothetical protein K488DRAFT_84699 [Vararia minispora EC-137]|uniref:Uncharacterized protein n=1 Tax=Vararia minispora EC-137 TaxID=1314806 RepID=A0ACB8QQ31_9AGAM|nr:hypothetical protein K488DRAFT_84699 [Vararia minispora EC-137]
MVYSDPTSIYSDFLQSKWPSALVQRRPPFIAPQDPANMISVYALLVLTFFSLFMAGVAWHVFYTRRKHYRNSINHRTILPTHHGVRTQVSTGSRHCQAGRLLTSVRVMDTFQRSLTDNPFYRGYESALELLEAGSLRAAITMPSVPLPTHIKAERISVLPDAKPIAVPGPLSSLPALPKARADVMFGAHQTYQTQKTRVACPALSSFPERAVTTSFPAAIPLTDLPLTPLEKSFIKSSRGLVRALSGFVQMACVSSPYLSASSYAQTLSVFPSTVNSHSRLNVALKDTNCNYPFRATLRVQCTSTRKRPRDTVRAVRRALLKPRNMHSLIIPRILVTSSSREGWLSSWYGEVDAKAGKTESLFTAVPLPTSGPTTRPASKICALESYTGLASPAKEDRTAKINLRETRTATTHCGMERSEASYRDSTIRPSFAALHLHAIVLSSILLSTSMRSFLLAASMACIAYLATHF